MIVVVEIIGEWFEVVDGVNIGLFLGCICVVWGERNGYIVVSILGSFFNCSRVSKDN